MFWFMFYVFVVKNTDSAKNNTLSTMNNDKHVFSKYVVKWGEPYNYVAMAGGLFQISNLPELVSDCNTHCFSQSNMIAYTRTCNK